jgi:Pentaxin family.
LAYTINGDKVDTSVADTAVVGAWHHFAFTKDVASGDMVAYMDGVEINRNSSAAGALLKPDSFMLGRRSNNTQYFTGTMDDFRLYDTVLSDWEIQSVMNGGGLVSHMLNQDTDQDGVNDFLEDAFAMDMYTPDAHLLTTFAYGGSGDIDYTVRNLKDNYTYVLQTSKDLVSWDDYQSMNGKTGGSMTTVPVPMDHYGANRPLFIRVKVSD